MRVDTVLFILATSVVVYFVTSTSNKTTGRVSEYSEVSLPDLKEDSELIEEVTSPKTLEDLTLPQLLALDPETEEFLRNMTIEEPEETAEWALNIENEFARYKVLRSVLYTWADQSPRTCAFWIEQMPKYDINLDLYITVARSWAASAPTAAIEEYRSNDEKTGQPKYGSFIIPLTKAILEVWAQNSPDLAASWVTQNISRESEKKEILPVIMHAWFKSSYPNRLFSWLIQFKYDEQADLDSVFLMQEWVKKDSTGPFEWISKQLTNDYIEELSAIACETLADKSLKMCEKHLNNKAFSSIHSHLIQAIIVKTAGKDDSKALMALNKLNDLKLVDSIAEKSAMMLIGRDDDALKYVNLAGFLTFPALEEIFLKWAEIDSRKVLNWLKAADYNVFAADYFNRLCKEWNLEPGNYKIPSEAVKKAKEYIKGNHDLINTLIPIEDIPSSLAEKFQKEITAWNFRRIEIIEQCAAVWAGKNYEESFSYAMADSSTVFTSVCLRGILPKTPEKSFDKIFKRLEGLEDPYPVKELFSYLALSKAEKSPGKAFETLKRKGLTESKFVIQTIDLSINKQRNELQKSLDRLRSGNIHIYFPYYFYQYTRLDPNNSYKTLKKYSRKPWHNSALKAIAASYVDHHKGRIKNWLKSLPEKEKEVVSEIIR